LLLIIHSTSFGEGLVKSLIGYKIIEGI
jgi:hypothetical protein